MMDKEYFMNAGISQFDPTMHAWNSFTSSVPPQLNCNSTDQNPSSCFLNMEKQGDHFTRLESGLSSMLPPSSNSAAVPGDALLLRELIRKLGGPACHSSGEVFPAGPAYAVAPHTGTLSNPASYNTTPMSSPPKQLPVPMMDQFMNGHLPNLRNSVPLHPGISSLGADPGFAERAAKFSCFGSRSFNGRTSPFVVEKNAELPLRSNVPFMGNGKLPRVLSSPSLKQAGSPTGNKNLTQPQVGLKPAAVNRAVPPVGPDQRLNPLTSNGASNSNEESSLSEQVPSGDIGLKPSNEPNSRKRKAPARGKAKEDASSSQPVNSNKGAEVDADKSAKRPKPNEANGSENANAKTKAEEEAKNNDSKTGEDKANQKPPEPPKDYIHVRARRGQATDSHSLAERVRREKISERMKLLQDLVPGCNKVTGKALMLDEIINYVQSLQRQVEFLSMKLASVNPRLDNMETLLSKEILQPNASLPHLLFPMDSSEPGLYKNQHHQSPPLQNNNPVDEVNNSTLCGRSLGLQLPPMDGFIENLPQFPPFSEDDLHSIVQMGYGQDASFQSQGFPTSNQVSHMKVEL